MRRWVFGLLLLSVLSVFSWSAIYYVDFTNGLDSNNGLTTITAWKTVTKVNSSMGSFAAGDSIMFKRGETWSGTAVTITCSGASASSRITFSSYGTGAKPVISGGAAGTFNSTSAISYITIDGFTLSPSAGLSGVAMLSADKYDIIIKNCDVTSGNNAFFITRTDGITIQNCTASGHAAGGVVFYGQSGQTFGVCNGLVEDCTITGGTDCFNIHPDDTNTYMPGNNFTFRRCVGSGASENIFDCGKYLDPVENVVIEDFEAYNSSSIAVNVALKNGYVRRGYIHNSTNIGIRLGTGTDGIEISDNILKNNTREDFTLTTTAGASVKNVKLYNNTIYNDVAKTYSSIYLRANSNLLGFEMKNNIVWGSGVSGAYILTYETPLTPTSTNSIIDYNLYWRDAGNANYKFRVGGTSYATYADWQAGYGQDSHSPLSDPQFADLVDMCPMRRSPCINAGANVNITNDFKGRRVPFGKAPDIGANEYTRSIMTVLRIL